MIWNTIVASVQEAMPNSKVKKRNGCIWCGCLCCHMLRDCCDRSEVKFDDNAVALVDKQGQPSGIELFRRVPHELRKQKDIRILALAEHRTRVTGLI